MKYFFVRGHYKSGTNWVSNMLNLHPQIFVSGEYYFNRIKRGMDNFLKIPLNKKLKNNLIESYEKIIKESLIINYKESKKTNVLYCGDRTPSDLEPLLLKDFLQFFIVRDGRDVIVSYIYHQIRFLYYGGTEIIDTYPYLKYLVKNFPSLMQKYNIFKKDINYFEKNPKSLLDDEKYVRHMSGAWSDYIKKNFEIMNEINSKDRNKSRVCLIRYENLHKNIEFERKRLYWFLGLDPSLAGSLDEKTSPGFKKVNNLSFFRKGQVGDWKKYFTKKTLCWFNEEAGETLSMLEKFEKKMDAK